MFIVLEIVQTRKKNQHEASQSAQQDHACSCSFLGCEGARPVALVRQIQMLTPRNTQNPRIAIKKVMETPTFQKPDQ